MDKIKTIINKEWAEVFKNKLVLFSVAFLPLMLTALPLVTIYSMQSLAPEEMASTAEGNAGRVFWRCVYWPE